MIITAPDYSRMPPVEPEPHRVDKPWEELRARCAMLGGCLYRTSADDGEQHYFVVTCSGIRMFADAASVASALDAAEREDEARRGVRLRAAGLAWEPKG